MLLFRPSKDQDVVQVDHHDAFRYEVPEDIVHYGLEGSRTVSHAKEHYQGFEQTSIGPEGCLLLISGFNADVVETPANVQLSEVSGSVELRYEFGDQWEEVLILDHHGVECSVVLNQLEEAVLFLMKNTGAAMGDLEGQICLVRRFSFRKESNSFCSTGDRG